ncbi:hypothetical protein [Streptomyces sp. NPDC093089]
MDTGGVTYSYAGTDDHTKPFRSRVATDLTNDYTWFRPLSAF